MNRRDVLGGMMLFAGAMSAETGSPADKWSDRTVNLEQGKTRQEAFGSVTVFHEGPTDQLSYLVAGSVLLQPGQEPHPPHHHPEEEFMLVTEGSGEIVVAGTRSAAGPGTLMYCEGNREHGIKNTGSVPMRFFYSKWSVRNRT